jgi:acetylornithine deacetylase/succinyl-diaminopimelate desuccinylase-like protein
LRPYPGRAAGEPIQRHKNAPLGGESVREGLGSAYDPPMAITDPAAEATKLLQRLIRFDTVNPPGNERAAQEYLSEYLTEAGFECELLGAEPERPNLVARLRGGDRNPAHPAHDGPTLCYLSHVDTVLANAEEWDGAHGPWSGDLTDGFIWGRGALDMKSQTAAEIAAAAGLARSGWRPDRGELLIVVVVDEETGGALGAQWITKEHPEKVRCDLLVNEGGGAVFEYGGRRHYGVCCAEKGVFRFTVTTDGVAGHASMPKMGDNALLKMAPVLQRLAAKQPAYELTAEPQAFLKALGEDPNDPARAVAKLGEADERLVTMFEPMLGVTFTPTRIKASEKINVIPSSTVLKVDCRVPPGLGEEEVRRGIAEVLEPAKPKPDEGLGDSSRAGADTGADTRDDWRIDFTERIAGNRSPIESSLMDAIDGWVKEHDEGADVVPVILPGFTDSRHFREAFPECVAYGFFPQRHQTLFEAAPLIHAADERIDARDLAFATEFFADLALRILGP